GERDDMLVTARHIARDRHTQSGAQCSAGVTCAEGIMLAFSAQHKAIQAARLADGRELLFTPREQLMHVALMADVEDEAVVRRVEDVVHGNRQLDDSEIWPDVPTSFGNTEDQTLANFLRQPLQFDHPKPLYISGRLDLA